MASRNADANSTAFLHHFLIQGLKGLAGRALWRGGHDGGTIHAHAMNIRRKRDPCLHEAFLIGAVHRTHGLAVQGLDTLHHAEEPVQLFYWKIVCAAVGATQMVIHSPFTTWDYNNLDMMAGQRDRLFTNTHAVLDPVVSRAADMGVVLVMENIEDIVPADRKLLCESFASPALQLSIDTGHAQYAHGSTGAPPVDYFVRSAGEMLNHIHLQDADGHADRHWAIGDGNILWTSVFAAIGELTVKPRLILELRDKSGIPASMAWLAAKGLGQ